MYSNILYICYMKKSEVILSKYVQKEVLTLPKNIIESLITWVKAVEDNGIREVRKISGYHDEPLKGDRKGQRSVRLNRAYRLIYIIDENGELEIIKVIEVNKHKY